MEEVIKKNKFAEFENDLLAPFLISKGVSCNGHDQDLIFEIPIESNLQIDFKGIKERFPQAEFEAVVEDFDFASLRYSNRIIAYKLTIKNY